MKVFFYGRLADVMGAGERTVDPPPEVVDVGSLRRWLGADDPALCSSLDDPTVRVIVNDEIVHGDAPLSQADEVAFLPAVSGG